MEIILSCIFIIVHIVANCAGDPICPNPIVVHLTEPRGVISTPNFPGKFPTPLCYHWIIDAGTPYPQGSSRTGKIIRIYLTQLYLMENLTFVEYYHYPFSGGRKSHGSSMSMPIPGGIHNKTDMVTRMYATSYRYFGVQVELNSEYARHLRARNFLDVYGFNLTYEILSEKENNKTWNQSRSCTIRSCSMAGNCVATNDFSRFFCNCLPGRSGDRCEYSASCDPKLNTTFCYNGGICRMHGYGVGSCSCPRGFRGPFCQTKVQTPVRECPGPNCEDICEESKESQHQPCSCHTGRIIPKGWMRYEVTLQSSDQTLPTWDSRSSTPKSVTQTISNYRVSLEAGIQAKLFEISGPLQYENKAVNSSVSMVSFGPASKFAFQFFGPNSTFHYENIKSNLTNTTLFKGFRTGTLFEFASYPALSLKKLSSHSTKLRVGQDFSITCEAEGSRRVTFKWFKDGVPINPSAAVRQIHENPPKRSQSSFASHSILMFDSATGSDHGVFTCQVSDMGEEHCQNITIDILQLPVIEVEPMSLTLNKGAKDQVILCITENESWDQNFTYSWTKDFVPIIPWKSTNEVIEKLLPYGSLLRIKDAQFSATYSCVVENSAGRNSTDVEVKVLDSRNSPSCRAEYDPYKLYWNKTSVEQIAKRKCPPDYVGFVQRKCNPNSKRRRGSYNMEPVWGHSDFSRCVSRELRALNKTIQSIKMGFSGRYHLLNLARRVNMHLEEKSFLYIGECDRIVSLLLDIGNYALDKREKVGGDEETFLRTFLNGTIQLLRFPGSCSSESTVILLNNMIHKMFTLFSLSPSSPTILHSDVLLLERSYLTWSSPLKFPLKTSDWAELRLEVPNDEDLRHENVNSSITFSVLRNLTSLVTNSRPQWTDTGQLLELITPILFFNASENYRILHDECFHLYFNVSKELGKAAKSGEVNLTCGSMDDNPTLGISWKINACNLVGIESNQTVHCACEQLGQFGILVFTAENEISQPLFSLHWVAVTGVSALCFSCVFACLSIVSHLKLQLTCKSIYTLKLLTCVSLILSNLFVISSKPGSNSIPLCIGFCSLFILSLCAQLSIGMNIFLATKSEVYPWFRTVPILSITVTLFIAASLPLWTAAVVYSYWTVSTKTEDEDETIFILDQTSPVLLTFIATVGLVVSVILVIYCKTLMAIRILRINIITDKIQTLVYRMKSLNRNLLVTAFLVLSIIGAIIHSNFPDMYVPQCLYGISTCILALIILYSYTIKSEYPIPARLAYCLCSHQPDIPDPEIPSRTISSHPIGRLTLSNNNHSNADSESKFSRRSNNSVVQGEPLLPILRPIQEDSDFQMDVNSADPILIYRSRNLTGNSDQSTSDPETIETLLGTGSFESRSTRHGSLSSGKRVQLEDPVEYGASKYRRRKSNSTNGSINNPVPVFQNTARARSQSVFSNSSSPETSVHMKPTRGVCLLSNSDSDYVPPSIPPFGRDSRPVPPIPRRMSIMPTPPTPSPLPQIGPTYPSVSYVQMKLNKSMQPHYPGYESMEVNSQQRLQIESDGDGGYETVRGE